LGAARQFAGERQGVDPARDGLGGKWRPRIYASTQVHHCIYRAAAILGLGRAAVLTIDTDDSLRLSVADLRRRIIEDIENGCTPIAVVASTGTINSGAVDPIPEIGELCHELGIWFHIDGAYGLLGVLDPEVAHLYGDLSIADSMVVDPHKWLATSMGCGGIYVRDENLLARAFTLESAVYVEGSQPIYSNNAPIESQFDDFGYAFHHFGVEHSLPSRGVEVWAVLKEIGAKGVKARVCRHNQYARRLAECIKSSSDLELLAPVILSTCCFRYVPKALKDREDQLAMNMLNQLNRVILGRVRARGRCMPSATWIRDLFAIRSCFINPRSTTLDVDALADEVRICGIEAWNDMRAQPV